MRILILIIPAVLIIVGFWVGARAAKANRLGRAERRELNTLRELRDTLTRTAIDHAALGEPMAQIVLDEISRANRERENR